MKPQVYKNLYDLYDINQDGNIDLQELEVMIKELLIVRREEAKRVMDEFANRRSSHGGLDREQRILLDMEGEARDWGERIGKQGKSLLDHYNFMLREGLQNRCIILRSQLDYTHDGRISLQEFLDGAGIFILPTQELQKEVDFYTLYAKQMRADAIRRGDDVAYDGCIQQ